MFSFSVKYNFYSLHFAFLLLSYTILPMIITPLGHTEFLIDIENSSGRNVRIMVD